MFQTIAIDKVGQQVGFNAVVSKTIARHFAFFYGNQMAHSVWITYT